MADFRIKPTTSPRGMLLIADSDRRVVRSLQRQLRAGGYTVISTDTGQQTIQLLDTQHPQLLLVGDYLADGDGRWICEKIKANERLGFVPVILMTEQNGQSEDEDAELSPDATLRKPINSRELQDWLRRLLRIKLQYDRPRRRVIDTQEIEMLKSEIITTVSHELNTPLVQVKAAVSLLAEDLLQHGSEEQSRVAAMATQAVGRLESVTDNIKQLAQTHQIRTAPVAVSDAIDLAIRLIDRSWASHGASDRIEKRLDDGLPLVWADKRALARLLQLLLDNALKFSPDDSPVYAHASLEDDDHVWIGVQDFGIGIPESEHDQIFEAFYQIDGSSTRRYGGTGTGLALAMLLANGMNTIVGLDSDVGKGSTFYFTLPAVDLADL